MEKEKSQNSKYSEIMIEIFEITLKKHKLLPHDIIGLLTQMIAYSLANVEYLTGVDSSNIAIDCIKNSKNDLLKVMKEGK